MPSDAAAKRVLNALKRRFITPENMLRHLGMDSALLKDTKPMRNRRLARDQEETENGSTSASDLIQVVAQALLNMAPEEADSFIASLKDLSDAEDVGYWAQQVLGDPTDPDATTDEPPPFPGKPARSAMDSRRPRSYTAEEEADFARRWPGAARIGRHGL